MRLSRSRDCAHQMKKDVVETYALDKNRISAVYNGIETSRVIPRKEDSFKQELDFSGNEEIILFIGRLCDKKAFFICSEPLRLLSPLTKNTRLVIVGNGNYDTYLKGCEAIWSKAVFTCRMFKAFLQDCGYWSGSIHL